ncbi:MAG: tRNA (cmo5U34)-methyltransferase, partial [Desulfobacterales bacterium]
PNETIHYIGIDSSDAMLEKGRKKAVNYKKDSQISFVHSDITAFEMTDIAVFICNYTLQFIRPVIREAFLTRVFSALRPGGALFLSEKTITMDPAMNRKYIDIYHDYKKEMGYSELEIAKKREALENVLIPFSIQENKNLLRNAGFSEINTYFQWFNFTSIVAVKPEKAGEK